MKASLCDVLVACIRVLHYFAQGITDPVHIYVSYRLLKIHVRSPYGPMQMLFGLGNCRTIRRSGCVLPCSDAERGNQSCRAVLRSEEEREHTYGLYIPSQTLIICDFIHTAPQDC